MLAVSWLACVFVVDRLAVPSNVIVRLSLGTLALLFLLIAEATVSVFGFQRTLCEHVQVYRAFPAQIGLAAQIVFASFPLLCRR